LLDLVTVLLCLVALVFFAGLLLFAFAWLLFFALLVCFVLFAVCLLCYCVSSSCRVSGLCKIIRSVSRTHHCNGLERSIKVAHHHQVTVISHSHQSRQSWLGNWHETLSAGLSLQRVTFILCFLRVLLFWRGPVYSLQRFLSPSAKIGSLRMQDRIDLSENAERPANDGSSPPPMALLTNLYEFGYVGMRCLSKSAYGYITSGLLNVPSFVCTESISPGDVLRRSVTHLAQTHTDTTLSRHRHAQTDTQTHRQADTAVCYSHTQTDRHRLTRTHAHRHTGTHRQTQTYEHTQTDTQPHTETCRYTRIHTQTNTHTHRHTYGQTRAHTDSHIRTHTDRHTQPRTDTHRQTDRHRHTDRHTDTHRHT
jgi:hypothetical protein